MIQTAADLYGADVQTRSEPQNLPEVTYHDIDEGGYGGAEPR